MPVIGISIKNINAKRYAKPERRIRVNNNTKLKEVKEQNLSALKKKGLSVGFEFKTTYVSSMNKPLAEIIINGNVLFLDKRHRKILSNWKKNKKLPEDVNLQLVNAVLRKCLLRALDLSEELQLPPPIALPFARKRGGETRYIG
jgi:hypothetical protein